MCLSCRIENLENKRDSGTRIREKLRAQHSPVEEYRLYDFTETIGYIALHDFPVWIAKRFHLNVFDGANRVLGQGFAEIHIPHEILNARLFKDIERHLQ